MARILGGACSSALLLAAGLGVPGAWAQTAPASGADNSAGTGIETVIVTAQRRSTDLQETPVAITAFGSRALEARSVTDVQSLATAATGLSYNKVSNFVQLSIRGVSLEQINLGGEPGVAFHMDGVYVARPFAADAVLSDLERVEVLRGPQGTLYGRNATGGSVNLIPNQPRADFAASVGLTLGDYARRRGEFMVNGALNDSQTVQGRISVTADQHDGYITNLGNGEDLDDGNTLSARAALGIDFSPATRLILSVDHTRTDDTGPVFDVGRIPGTAPALGGQVTADPRTIYIDGPASNDFKASGVSARLTTSFGDLEFVSITSYRDTSFRLQSDLDGTDFFLINEDLREAAEQWSQEFQLSSKGSGRLDWLIGAYAFTEDGTLNYAFPVPLLATTITFDANQKTDAYAVFGQASYHFTDRLTGTFGLRYSHESKSGDTTQFLFVRNAVSLSDSWNAWTPKIGFEYQLNDRTMAYISVSRGFKAGGLNTTSLQADAYDPEYIWSTEVGVKMRAFDNRLQLNWAAFAYEYSDLQVNQFAVGQSFIANAASARGQGLEVELLARPTPGFQLDASLSALDATFDEFSTLDTFRPELGILDLKGNSLPRAPRISLGLGLQQAFSLPGGSSLTARADYAYKSEFYFTPFNTDYARSPSTGVVNARLAWEDSAEQWSVAVFGRNLTDEVVFQTVTVSGINAGTIVLYAPPRTWGLELKRTF
jgi:iron complex outermembrane recepter protein